MGSSWRARPDAAMRTVVGVFGVLAALAASEHGLGEILQGPVAPDGLVIRSWPRHEGFKVLDGEPALTVLPDLLISGIATVVVAAVFAAWVLEGVHRRHGSLVLAALSMLLFVVGGGFGPPLLGIILAVGSSRLPAPFRRPARASRAMAAAWPWALGVGVLGYLGLVPGTLVVHAVWGTPSTALVYGLMVMAFGGLLLALAGARARYRLASWAAASGSPRGAVA